MTRETYRWAVVDKDGRVVNGILETTEETARGLNEFIHGFGAGNYTVKKFRLVECAEGEGDA